MSNYKLKQTFVNIFHFVIYVLDTKPKTRRNVKRRGIFKQVLYILWRKSVGLPKPLEDESVLAY